MELNEDRIDKIAAAAKEVTKSVEAAEKFLKSAGIVDENGELAKQYREEKHMSDEEFNILHQDLAARCPYDVIVDYNGDRVMIDTVSKFGEVQPEGCNYTVSVEEVKPYLYPHDMMSSDPKLREEFSAMVRKEGLHFDNVTNFYNSHHIDYRDMIKKGLAIKITNENNPYKK